MSDWAALERELDRWGECGRQATMWWRDDDAAAPSDGLRRLLSLAADFDAAIALAVIPARMDSALGPLVAAHPGAVVLQHGYAHANHARANEKKIELGPQRPFAHTLADLAAGWQSLASAIGRQAVPVLVPPWNRIAPGLLPLLPEIGFRGLSMFGPRRTRRTFDQLCQVNAHIDIVDWRVSRTFVGRAPALSQAIAHLEARRTGQADSDEPTGLLTHHAIHDSGCWQFVEEWLTRTRRHAAVRWLVPDALFDSAGNAEVAAASTRNG